MKTDELVEPKTRKAADRPAPVAPADEAPRRAWDDFSVDETPGFFARHRIVTSIVAVALAGALAFFWKDIFPKKSSVAPHRDTVVVVNVPPPPPPPPPVAPPPPPPPMEEKMIEQAPVEDEAKPEEKADEPPPADLSGGIKGDGPPDGFGLTGGTGRAGTGGTGTGSAQQRSRWGWYASQVQSRVQQAVRSDRKTRTASLRAEVKIWADSTGRITRATVANSNGAPALDAALRDEILTGLQLSEPPPAGMPMPINLRITLRRR